MSGTFRIFRVVIGARFDQKIFRVDSMRGQIVDKILELRGTGKGKIPESYFTNVSYAQSAELVPTVVRIHNAEESNVLEIHGTQILLRKTSLENSSTVSVAKCVSEFEIFWNSINSVLENPGIRRLGMVAELQVASNVPDVVKHVVSTLVKVPPICHSGTFTLLYEDRDQDSENKRPDFNKSDYWTTIYTINPRDSLEYVDEGNFVVSIDAQKHYSPSATSISKELKAVHSRLTEKKEKYKEFLIQAGLADSADEQTEK